MNAITYTTTNLGVEGRLITVEVNASRGLPTIKVFGMADRSIREAAERVVTVCKSIGVKFSMKKIRINLAPADLPKHGSGLDLAIGIGIYSALVKPLDKKIFAFGEIGINGIIRSSRGVIQFLEIALNEAGSEGIVLIPSTAVEYCKHFISRRFDTERIFPVKDLQEVVALIQGGFKKHTQLSLSKQLSIESQEKYRVSPQVRLEDIMGNETQKRAFIVGIAGGHNMILSGPMGIGKSLLIQSIEGLIPDPTPEQKYEIEKNHSATTNNSPNPQRIQQVISINKDNSFSELFGTKRNGEIGILPLAHYSYVIMEELPEFRKEILNSLKQLLDKKHIMSKLANFVTAIPTDISLICSMNICPCGKDSKECMCRPNEKRDFYKKIPQSFINRIDMNIPIYTVNLNKGNCYQDEKSIEIACHISSANKGANHNNDNIFKSARQQNDAKIHNSKYQGVPRSQNPRPYTTAYAQDLIKISRAIQQERYNSNSRMKNKLNSRVSYQDFRNYFALDSKSEELIANAIDRYLLSGRDYVKILQIAKSLEDLELAENIIKEIQKKEEGEYKNYEEYKGCKDEHQEIERILSSKEIIDKINSKITESSLIEALQYRTNVLRTEVSF